MIRRIFSALSALSCAVFLAVPTIAANMPVAQKRTTPKQTVRSAWPPETLSGTIMMVDPAANLAVVKGPGGVPFDMIVTPATRIKSGDQTLTLTDLSADLHKNVSIRFVPERKGDVASSIQLNG